MNQRHNNNYTNGPADSSLLQYSHGFNASDHLFSHNNDQNHNEADWAVNSSSLSSQPHLSRNAVYQTPDWASPHLSAQGLDTQHGHVQNDIYRGSPLPSNTFNPTAFGGYGTQPTYNFQQHAQYDPSLIASATQAFKQFQPTYPTHDIDTRTIQPHALEHETSYNMPPSSELIAGNSMDQLALAQAIPAGKQSGIFQVIDFDHLVRVTNSERMSAFATIAKDPQDWDINRAALPMYVPRQSKNALKRLAGPDGTLLAKINQKAVRKPRLAKSTSSKPMKTAGDVASLGSAYIKSEKSMQTEDSSSEESESDYTSESDIEESPLPTKRPGTSREATEYDTIKALWRSKRKAVNANEVRQGLVKFWEVVKTIRDRWKTDTAAVTQAEEKQLKGELPLLRQRVNDQRDMIEIAFKAALKHGNRTIIETLSENAPLLFLCYQFLLDRFKADDVNGSLARSILEVMALFSTVTTEKLDKVYLTKVLPRYVKTGDAKTQFYAKAILNKAVANDSPRKAEVKTAPPAANGFKAETTTGIKRSANAADTGPATKKLALGAAKSTTSAAAPTPGTAKKRLLGEDAGKPAAKKAITTNGVVVKHPTSDAAAAAKPKAASSKLTNSLYANLQSAAKKPGTSVKSVAASTAAKPDGAVKPTPAATPAPAKSVFSFAETMRNLTQPKEEKPAPKAVEKEILDETPQQKARRLRREARGPLRVHWKSNEDLVAVREFTHDPEEETGHDSSQTRDVTDLKGEGRMFKQQHNKMDIDDEDDEPAPEVPMKLIDWYEPAAVDFSEVPKEERDRNYFPYGGGSIEPESAETAERKKYEDSTLMVFYSHSDDIPATPREPDEAITGEDQTVTTFGAVKEEYIDRAARRRATLHSQRPATAQSQAKSIDFNALRNALSLQHTSTAASFQAPAVTAPAQTLDLQAIIAQLGQQNKAPPQPYMLQPPLAPPSNPFAGLFQQAPQPAAPSAVPNGQANLQAILASLQSTAQPQQPVPPPPPPTAAATLLPPPLAAANPQMSMMDPGFQAYLAQHFQQQQQQQQPVVPNGLYEDPERRKWRDQNSPAAVSVDADQKDNPFYKTKICKYWQEGKCVKGDNCTYRHG